jgi:hypothetical protein
MIKSNEINLITLKTRDAQMSRLYPGTTAWQATNQRGKGHI